MIVHARQPPQARMLGAVVTIDVPSCVGISDLAAACNSLLPNRLLVYSGEGSHWQRREVPCEALIEFRLMSGCHSSSDPTSIAGKLSPELYEHFFATDREWRGNHLRLRRAIGALVAARKRRTSPELCASALILAPAIDSWAGWFSSTSKRRLARGVHEISSATVTSSFTAWNSSAVLLRGRGRSTANSL
jgi:hypothetical protein